MINGEWIEKRASEPWAHTLSHTPSHHFSHVIFTESKIWESTRFKALVFKTHTTTSPFNMPWYKKNWNRCWFSLVRFLLFIFFLQWLWQTAALFWIGLLCLALCWIKGPNHETWLVRFYVGCKQSKAWIKTKPLRVIAAKKKVKAENTATRTEPTPFNLLSWPYQGSWKNTNAVGSVTALLFCFFFSMALTNSGFVLNRIALSCFVLDKRTEPYKMAGSLLCGL